MHIIAALAGQINKYGGASETRACVLPVAKKPAVERRLKKQHTRQQYSAAVLSCNCADAYACLQCDRSLVRLARASNGPALVCA